MKNVRSSPDSSKSHASPKAPAAPSHPPQDSAELAGAASPLPAPAPHRHRSPVQPPAGPGPRVPTEPPIDSNEPPSEHPDASRPILAVRSDLKVLLSVEDLGPQELQGRTLWTGVVLTPEEVDVLQAKASNAEHETAARVISALRKRGKPGGN